MFGNSSLAGIKAWLMSIDLGRSSNCGRCQFAAASLFGVVVKDEGQLSNFSCQYFVGYTPQNTGI
jgi:hypothetical protein